MRELKHELEEAVAQLDSTKSQLREKSSLLQEVLQVLCDVPRRTWSLLLRTRRYVSHWQSLVLLTFAHSSARRIG